MSGRTLLEARGRSGLAEVLSMQQARRAAAQDGCPEAVEGTGDWAFITAVDNTVARINALRDTIVELPQRPVGRDDLRLAYCPALPPQLRRVYRSVEVGPDVPPPVGDIAGIDPEHRLQKPRPCVWPDCGCYEPQAGGRCRRDPSDAPSRA